MITIPGGHENKESIQFDQGADTVYFNADNDVYPFATDSGETIYSNLVWVPLNKELILMHDFANAPDSIRYTYGNWLNVSTDYLAFYFKKNNATYYGWIFCERMPVPLNIKAWAYRK